MLLHRLPVAVLAVAFIALPGYDLARFALHRRFLDAIAFQSALELVVVFGLLLVGLSARSRTRRLIIVAIVVAAYLRRHHVDLPAIAGLVYVEIILLIGAALWRWVGGRGNSHALAHVPLLFLTGLCAWLAPTLAMAAFGLATPGRLGLVTLAAGGVGLVAVRRTVLAALLLRTLSAPGRTGGRVALAFVLTLFLTLLAKTNVVLTFDSLWYGLRGEYVLAEGGRFFDPSGLVHFVHYYPKLFELFLLPLAWFGDYSFVLTASIAALGLVLITAIALLRVLKLEVDASLIAIAVLASLPVLACLALQSKPDVLNTFLLLTGAYCLLLGWRQHSWSYLLFSLSALILALGTKLTSLAYSSVLMLSWSAVVLIGWRRRWPMDPPLLRIAGWTAIAAMTVVAVLTWRTYHLTGFPVIGPTALVDLLRSFGFSEEAPVLLARAARLKTDLNFPDLLWRYYFSPASFTYVRLWWPGNLWLLLTLLLVVAARSDLLSWFRAFFARWWLLLPVVATGLILSALVTGSQQGGVPYYHMIAFCLLNLIVIFEALKRFAGGSLPILLAAFATFHFALVLTIVPSGSSGTRGLDLNFVGSVWDTAEYKDGVLGRAGLASIARYLSENIADGEICRGVGQGNQHKLHFLPCRIESYRAIGELKPELLGTPAIAAEYLRKFDIRFLIAPNWDTAGDFNAVFDCLALLPEARVLRDHRYRLLDLREVDLGRVPICLPRSTDPSLPLENEFAAASVANPKKPERTHKLARPRGFMGSLATVAFQLPANQTAAVRVKASPWARFLEIEIGFQSVNPAVQQGCLLKLSAEAEGLSTEAEFRPDPNDVETVRLPWPAGGGHPTLLRIEFRAERRSCLEPLLLVNPRLVPGVR